MRARLASSFSRNGIREAATETKLHRRDVHQLHFVPANKNEFAALSGRDVIVDKATFTVHRGVCLGDGMPFFLKCGKKTNLAW